MIELTTYDLCQIANETSVTASVAAPFIRELQRHLFGGSLSRKFHARALRSHKNFKDYVPKKSRKYASLNTFRTGRSASGLPTKIPDGRARAKEKSWFEMG